MQSEYFEKRRGDPPKTRTGFGSDKGSVVWEKGGFAPDSGGSSAYLKDVSAIFTQVPIVRLKGREPVERGVNFH
jgi:hypothetical protein